MCRFIAHRLLIAGILILFSALSLPSLTAQEWDEVWRGDKELFHYENGLITYRDDNKAGKARLWRTADAPISGQRTWTFQTYFNNERPTSQNSFTLTLLTERTENREIAYEVAPDATGQQLLLRRVFYKRQHGKRGEMLSRKTLSRHRVRHYAQAWSSFFIQVEYDQAQGIRLKSKSHVGALEVSDWVPLSSNDISWAMELHTTFTAKKKLQYKYQLPTISDEKESQEPLKYTEVQAEQSGKITVTLNKPVDTSLAVVHIEGLNPTISQGATPYEIIVMLGAAFQPNRTYEIAITGLVNMAGEYEEIAFTIVTDPKNEGDHQMPEGIFITEVMASPPTSGPLRHVKYIELFNNSSAPIQLGLLQLQYLRTKYPLPNITLAPGAFALLYSANDPAPTSLGTLVPLDKFPALSSTFHLSIQTKSGKELDEIRFSSRIYGEGQPRGNTSVERVSYHPDIWRRSNHPDGGTPGAHTTLRPYNQVAPSTVVLNEIMLSPGAGGEKYLELFNNSNSVIDLADLYLCFTNKEEQVSTNSWLLVRESRLLEPGAYIVLCPYPETLAKRFSNHDTSTFVERIDFPSISSTYSEMEIRSHLGDQVIDRAIYRRQWLGAENKDRTGYSLEKRSPELDGTLRSTWRRATDESGGTPGVINSVHGLPSTSGSDEGDYGAWPQHPTLEYDQLPTLLSTYAHLAKVEVLTLLGEPILQGEGAEVPLILQEIQSGTAPLPTTLVIIRVTFYNPEATPPHLTYSATWLHKRH